MKTLQFQNSIGLSPDDLRRYSLVRAINKLGNHAPLDGIEGEASNAVAKICGREASGFFIPPELWQGRRDLAKGTGNLGGYSVQKDVLGSSLIELLRNQTVAFELGARLLSGLVGDVELPKQASPATCRWVAENEQTAPSNLTFGQVGLSAHRLSATSTLGKMLLAQSSVDVEGLVREDFARVLAIAIDRCALAGTGSDGQPLGILGTPGIGQITWGGSPTWLKLLEFEEQLADANALLTTAAWAMSPASATKMKAIPKIAASTVPIFLWESPDASMGRNNGLIGKVNGYPARATQQLGDTHRAIFGNWSDLVIADWIGQDVVVDPYTLADRHQIKVTINMLLDVCVRHPASFSVSTDSAAQ